MYMVTGGGIINTLWKFHRFYPTVATLNRRRNIGNNVEAFWAVASVCRCAGLFWITVSINGVWDASTAA